MGLREFLHSCNCQSQDYNKVLITSHNISNKKFNYNEEHYKEGLSSSIKYKTENDINNLAQKNLELLDKFIK